MTFPEVTTRVSHPPAMRHGRFKRTKDSLRWDPILFRLAIIPLRPRRLAGTCYYITMNATMRPLFLLLILAAAARADAASDDVPPAASQPRLAFVGLHGGIFDAIKELAPPAGIEADYVTDERIAGEDVDFSQFRMVFLQHVREEDREQYLRLLTAAKAANPALRIFSLSRISGGMLADLHRRKIVEYDPELSAYYGSSAENLRLLLRYLGVKYLGMPGEAPPAIEGQAPRGLYHPDAPALFPTVKDFTQWAEKQGRPVESAPRAVVAVHATHLAFQQPRVVVALVRELEKRGMLAVAMVDLGPGYITALHDFEPLIVIHTCHGSDTVAQREELGSPHLHSIFFRKQSIDQWRPGVEGLASSESAFQIVGQELLGAIEPQIGAGTSMGGGSEEAFRPIPERIEHLVDRAVGWMTLARIANRDKKIAVVYYDRELGQSELMRGSATGMFMNGPRSLVGVLKRMHQEGYQLSRVPQDEVALLADMQDHGRQIGVWAPGVLDRLARSGKAVLVPVEQYVQWFEAKVPEPQRKEVIAKWGPPPGKFLTWEDLGKQYIVIPRVDLGNVILVPQPLRGEAHDTSLLHDKLVPPPHNYLATYFWLQEQFHANALIHFGTHGSEFVLPGKPSGLSDYDWPDIVLGAMPNINPWIINNLGESSPARRRAYAVLIDHLTPPTVNAELSDDLLNLHNDIDHWVAVSDGPLKDKFAKSITEQVTQQKLDVDLKLAIPTGQVLSGDQIDKVLEYLHDIHNETTPINLHVFGEPPREDLLVPYLVTCLRKQFLESLGEVVEVPASEALNPGDRLKYLRRTAEAAIALVVRRGYSPEEALTAAAGIPANKPLPKDVLEGCRLASRLVDGFAHTHDELYNLLLALNGRYIPPGPGSSPDRNPGAVPTGRNMFVLNPEEVPSRPSWELGKQLVDELLADQLAAKGHYPERIGFSLECFATFQDFGVMEAEIIYLLGVRPVWDEQNLVVDVELIPSTELKRPRIDVFIASHGYYRDMLPTRMRLIDKAVRMVADLKEDEADNSILRHSRQIVRELTDRGVSAEKAESLAKARIFGYPPGQSGSAGYYYLVERSGEWDTREDLVKAYLAQERYVYTAGMWGEEAPEAYERQIQGTELVLRSWSDRTTSPLSNKYTWFHGGSLCLAVEQLTGKAPDFIMADLRDSDDAHLVSAADALRKDYRVRLFNRKWIEGMMKEGYAGADQIAVHVSNTLGWKIMRPGSVQDDIFEEIVDIYVRDKRKLAIREWLEAENPFAFQDVTEILLETIRKDYWNADEATRRELAEEYARSVVRHGEGGGLRGGGNSKLEQFVEQTLQDVGTPKIQQLLAQYAVRRREAAVAQGGSAPPGLAPGFGATIPSVASAATPGAQDSESNADSSPSPVPPPELESADANRAQQAKTEAVPVEGHKLEPTSPASTQTDAMAANDRQHLTWLVGGAVVLLLLTGFVLRRGSP